MLDTGSNVGFISRLIQTGRAVKLYRMSIITSDIFKKRGPLTEEVRRALGCRGTGVQARDLLARHRYDVVKGDGVAVPIASVEPGTGRIMGMRWATFGKVLEGVVNLKTLFPAIGGGTMEITVPGDSITWPTAGGAAGEPRNLSDWLVVGRGNTRVVRDEAKKILTDEEAKTLGVGDVLLRVSILVGAVDKAVVGGHLVPVDLEGLKRKADSWKVSIAAPNIPSVPLRPKNDTKSRREEIQLCCSEGAGVGLGFGILPILEEITAEEPSTINRDELERELCGFMRSVGICTNVGGVKGDRWSKAWTVKEAPVRKEAAILWPEFQGATGGQPDPGMFVPVSRPGSKFGGDGGVYGDDLMNMYEIPESLREYLVPALNGSLAGRTWKTYKSAYRAFGAAMEAHDMIPPAEVKVRHLLIFVGHCFSQGLAASTIRTYMSGIRKIVEARGGSFTEEDLGIIKAAVRGKANTEVRKPQRVLMSVPMMLKIKKELAGLGRSWAVHDKRVFWMLCTWLFWSSCRGGEMALDSEGEFNPESDLLWEDIKVEEECVSVRIKSPKEAKGTRNVEVELYEVGGNLCPMEALRKFREANKLGELEGLPVFRWESGRNLTLNKMNKLLRSFLKEEVDYVEGVVGIHCFRNSLPSLMKAGGYTEEQIRGQGRWASQAYLKYVKMNRALRREERQGLREDVRRAGREGRGDL